jgi:AraC family transcriptional regulator
VKSLGHGVEKFPTGQLLVSSSERAWRGVYAELRSHPAGELPTFTPTSTEVAMLVRGAATVTRRADGVHQQTAASGGTIWLCPAGLKEDFIVISKNIAEVLHIYLPANPFTALAATGQGASTESARLRYKAGFRDPLLESIAHCILMEMGQETSSGALLIETLASSLIARLLQSHSNISPELQHSRVYSNRLADRKLRHVLDFIETHIEGDLTVERIAATVSLSQFHFARLFKSTTGKSPHQYVSERRLIHAKQMLVDADRPLVDIAHACGFSSEGNFCRSFRRATGVTPGQFRALQMSSPDPQTLRRF